MDIFNEQKPDLVLLDVMMPGYDGWTVCREIRRTSTVPIIMITAKDEEIDQLFAYDLGVDDYITKPFSPKLLVAKMKALLRRLHGEGEENGADAVPAEGVAIDILTDCVLNWGIAVLIFKPSAVTGIVTINNNEKRFASPKSRVRPCGLYPYLCIDPDFSHRFCL